MNTILYDYVCDELQEVEKDGLKASNLDSTDKLVNIKKNLLKIEKYENEMDGGYSMGDGYRMNDRRMYGADHSMARRRDSRGRYSRDDAKEHMLDKLGEMMPMADDRQRDILENAMHQLENA